MGTFNIVDTSAYTLQVLLKPRGRSSPDLSFDSDCIISWSAVLGGPIGVSVGGITQLAEPASAPASKSVQADSSACAIPASPFGLESTTDGRSLTLGSSRMLVTIPTLKHCTKSVVSIIRSDSKAFSDKDGEVDTEGLQA